MTLTVQVVSAEKQVWSGEATMVVARTAEGELGILSGHEPVLAVLVAGEVRIGTGENAIRSGRIDDVVATVDGGFLSVEHDTVLIVAERISVADGAAGAPASRA